MTADGARAVLLPQGPVDMEVCAVAAARFRLEVVWRKEVR